MLDLSPKQPRALGLRPQAGTTRPNRVPQHPVRRIVALVLVLLVAVGLMSSDLAHDTTARLLNRASALIDVHPVGGAVIFVLLSAVSAMMTFVSSAVVVPVAVLTWGRGSTMAMLWIGWLIGGCCSYLIGRTLGRRIAEWLVSPEQLATYSAVMSQRVGFFTVLVFQLAVPSEVPGYVLGAVRYRFPLYLGALALAEVPFAVGAVYLGHSFLRRDYVLLMSIGLLGIAVSVMSFRHLHRTLAIRHGPSPARDPAAPAAADFLPAVEAER